jgi:hypothetical protein
MINDFAFDRAREPDRGWWTDEVKRVNAAHLDSCGVIRMVGSRAGNGARTMGT